MEEAGGEGGCRVSEEKEERETEMVGYMDDPREIGVGDDT